MRNCKAHLREAHRYGPPFLPLFLGCFIDDARLTLRVLKDYEPVGLFVSDFEPVWELALRLGYCPHSLTVG